MIVSWRRTNRNDVKANLVAMSLRKVPCGAFSDNLRGGVFCMACRGFAFLLDLIDDGEVPSTISILQAFHGGCGGCYDNTFDGRSCPVTGNPSVSQE